MLRFHWLEECLLRKILSLVILSLQQYRYASPFQIYAVVIFLGGLCVDRKYFGWAINKNLLVLGIERIREDW